MANRRVRLFRRSVEVQVHISILKKLLRVVGTYL